VPEFTPTEKRILNVLRDGQNHTKQELLACLNEDMPSKRLLSVTLFRIRKKLKTIGHDIVCVRDFSLVLKYRQVMSLRPSHLE
jgi:hypothetical protein